MSPSLITFATPLFHTAASVSGAVVRGAEVAFDRLLHLGENNASASREASDSTTGLQARRETLHAEFAQRALDLLAAAGISLDGPVVLERDVLGDLRVLGAGPEAAKIEAVLNGDSRLSGLAAELDNTERELIRRRRADEAERLYALDPEAARKSMESASPLDEQPLRVMLHPAPQ